MTSQYILTPFILADALLYVGLFLPFLHFLTKRRDIPAVIFAKDFFIIFRYVK